MHLPAFRPPLLPVTLLPFPPSVNISRTLLSLHSHPPAHVTSPPRNRPEPPQYNAHTARGDTEISKCARDDLPSQCQGCDVNSLFTPKCARPTCLRCENSTDNGGGGGGVAFRSPFPASFIVPIHPSPSFSLSDILSSSHLALPVFVFCPRPFSPHLDLDLGPTHSCSHLHFCLPLPYRHLYLSFPVPASFSTRLRILPASSSFSSSVCIPLLVSRFSVPAIRYSSFSDIDSGIRLLSLVINIDININIGFSLPSLRALRCVGWMVQNGR
ncbi:hypothetical protein C8R44DRAFT_893813 [Mycena epipterygia]|nr:hypothetical protein C8R44DRAFT_893813 [Mycena epipterygia]